MSSIFQTPEWERFKLATGYSKSFRVDDVLVLKKDLPLRRSMLYSPMLSEAQLSASIKSKVESRKFWEQIDKIAKEENSIFYRLELDVPSTYDLRLKTYGLKKSFEEMQPEHTLVLGITKTEEEILAQMKPKGRYNIKVAEKNNVIIRRSDFVDNFYSLYETMASRQKITFRSKRYFQTLVDTMREKGYCEVFEAWADRPQVESEKYLPAAATALQAGKVKSDSICLAAAIIIYYQDQAIYLFGGSSDAMRNVMAPYKLQWEAILEAKRRGCKSYDFFGIAPDDNPRHAWAGVTRFKKQFGGEEVSIYGSYDKIYKPFEYQMFKLAEKLRR